MDKKSKKEKTILYIFILIMYLLVFQNFLQKYIPIMRYFDEFLAVISIITGIIYVIKNKMKIEKDDLIILMCLIGITIIGFIPIFLYKYQTMKTALIDWIIVMKFFLIYFFSKILFKNINNIKYSKTINKNIKIIICTLLIFTIANYVFNIYSGEIRFGIKSNKLFYEHPTYLAAVCICLLANNILFSKKINNIYNYILIIILFSTLRIKAIGAAIAIICMIIYISKTNKKITVLKFGVIALICIMIAYNQISYYFIELDGSARQVLTETSFKIANEHSPIGTGFGTFGSYVSGEQYSQVYKEYGISQIWGLQENNPSFISDSFWPMLLGQFGYLGTILYAICLIIIFKRIQKEFCIENKYLYIAKVICIAYLIISSTSELAFANPIAIPLALIIGL